MAPTVLIETPDDAPEGVVVLTLNRPEKLNAMNATLVTELHQALDEVGRRPECRVIVLTGAGKGFCAGLDLGGYGGAPQDEGHGTGRVQQGFAVQQQIAALIPRLRRLRQPVIAAVNGAASGGGFALVLGSDVRIAAAGPGGAKFNAAFVRIGLSACDIGTSWLLPRIVGVARAQELMLTGRIFDAAEALRIGLVVETPEPADLLRRAYEEAELILRNSPFGVQMTKEVMWSALEIPGLQAAIDLENRTQIMTSFTEDHREAMTAFVERRDPNFGNR
jgi:enoyl-CoA hydratase